MANPGITTRGSIREQIRLRSDTVNSQFVTDAELNGYIQASYFELYDLLVLKYGDDYFVKRSTFTTDGVNDEYALPVDFFKLRGVDLISSDDSRITLHSFNLGERNRYSGTGAQTITGTSLPRYRLNGANLWLRPLPNADLTFEVLYVPRLVSLTTDADLIDGVSGWEEFIIVDCCIKVAIKEETDPSGFMAQKAALAARIDQAAENRDAAGPATVTDTSGTLRGIVSPWSQWSWPGAE